MKKLLSVLLAVAMCICMLAACGETEEDREDGGLFGDVLIEQIQQEQTNEVTEKTEEETTEEVVEPIGHQFALDMEAVTLTTIGETATIYSGSNADQVTWISEDSSVAGVTGGIVTAVGSGSTKIHAVYAGQDLICEVTCNLSMGASRDPIMSAPTYETVDSSFFDDAVFVGDSISLKLSYDTSGRLGNAQFLVQGSYGVGNAIYDVLVRHDQEITPEMSTTIEEDMETFLNTCKTNASNNGTTYKTELSNSLEAEGVETTGELRELKELNVQKTKYSENFYDQGLEDGTFAKKYIEEKAPYHIRHILIKTDDVSGSSVYNKEISKEESKKIYSIISRLASGKTTFGDVAYDASDDSSNSLYGSVGIMDFDTGFVSEFKYGVYYYDAFLSGKNDTGKTQEQLLEMLRIPSSIELGEGNTLNTKEVLDNSVFTVPYSAVEMFQAYADTTKTIDNKTYTDEIVSGSVRQSITSNYYPRNVLFNTYFNNHGLTFITDEGFGDTTGNANWTTPNAELKAVLGENFDGKILTDNGNPILVTYNPSTGLHFMIIEKSPINQKYTS